MPASLVDQAGQSLLDRRMRGMPPGIEAVRLADIGAKRWSVPNEDLTLPVMTISREAVAHNIATINAYAAEHGLFLCAHGKTMMAPQLLQRVLAGERTIGLCAATTQQATVMAETGAPNVFIANQVVGRANLRRLAELIDQHPATRFLVLVDSVAGVDQLLAHCCPAIAAGGALSLLVEIGVAGGRAGVRDLAAAKELVACVAAHQRAGAPLRLAGVSTYEGAVPAGPGIAARIDDLFALTRAVYDVVAPLVGAAEQPPLLSAGGSATFDLVTAAFAQARFAIAPQIWLRPGVAPTYDHVIYQQRLAEMDARGGFVLGGEVRSAVASFEPALALWAAVQSVVDGTTALIAAGIRDFPADAGYPTLLAHYRAGRLLATYPPGTHVMSRANDQHGYLPLADGLDLRVGDVLRFGISHPCTTFDKWPVLFEIDGEGRVVGAIRTYF